MTHIRRSSSKPRTQTSKGDLHLSDLDQSEPKRVPPSLSPIDFELSCASANRDIEVARTDLQSLMARAHAYASTTGVAVGTPLLTSVPPRHLSQAVSPKKSAGFPL